MSGMAEPPSRRVRDRWVAKGAAGPCPICRAEGWGVMRNADGDFTAAAAASPADALACLHGGFVRRHVAERLDSEDQAGKPGA